MNSLHGETISEVKEKYRKRVGPILDGLLEGRYDRTQALNMISGLLAVSELKSGQDDLMKIPNRKEFKKKIKQLIEMGVNFSLVIIDIDNFKGINDQYGHSTGDEVLKTVADVLKRTMRETDFIARYGGEEIVLILPVVTNDDLSHACERFRVAIEVMPEYSIDFKQIPKTTISLGAGVYKNGEDFDNFFTVVDKMLYKAKEGGRNRFEVAE